MTKKWGIPFLQLLPFLPLLLWGFHLPDAAYASLRFPGQAAAWPDLLVNSGSGYQAFSTSLVPIAVGLLARLGLETAAAAALLSTLGWGTSAVLMIAPEASCEVSLAFQPPFLVFSSSRVQATRSPD